MDYSKKISEKERRVKCQKQIHASSLLCGIHLVAKVVPAQAHSVVGCCFFWVSFVGKRQAISPNRMINCHSNYETFNSLCTQTVNDDDDDDDVDHHGNDDDDDDDDNNHLPNENHLIRMCLYNVCYGLQWYIVIAGTFAAIFFSFNQYQPFIDGHNQIDTTHTKSAQFVAEEKKKKNSNNRFSFSQCYFLSFNLLLAKTACDLLNHSLFDKRTS